MMYSEVKKDLFSVPEDFYLAHCISSDFAMGAGIAVRFRDMGVKAELLKYERENPWKVAWTKIGYCIPTSAGKCKEMYKGVFNLVTKEKYYHKPTYDTIHQALYSLLEILSTRTAALGGGKVHAKIAMPLIGCGLDGLEWAMVSELIQNTFKDTAVEILVCRL